MTGLILALALGPVPLHGPDAVRARFPTHEAKPAPKAAVIAPKASTLGASTQNPRAKPAPEKAVITRPVAAPVVVIIQKNRRPEWKWERAWMRRRSEANYRCLMDVKCRTLVRNEERRARRLRERPPKRSGMRSSR
jgi:hypothetical protein